MKIKNNKKYHIVQKNTPNKNVDGEKIELAAFNNDFVV